MKTARMDSRRQVNWAEVKPEYADALPSLIVEWLKGRPNSRTRFDDVCRWFYATPKAAIDAALDTLTREGKVRLCRTSMSRNCGYEYVLEEN